MNEMSRIEKILNYLEFLAENQASSWKSVLNADQYEHIFLQMLELLRNDLREATGSVSSVLYRLDNVARREVHYPILSKSEYILEDVYGAITNAAKALKRLDTSFAKWRHQRNVEAEKSYHEAEVIACQK